MSLSDGIVELDIDEHPGVRLLMIRWTKTGQVNMWVTTSVKKANSSILFSEILRKVFQSLGIFPLPVTVYLNLFHAFLLLHFLYLFYNRHHIYDVDSSIFNALLS